MERDDVFGASHKGLRRRHNEDAFLVRPDLGLLVVADGMGGHAAGEVAAAIAVREVERYLESSRGEEADRSVEGGTNGRALAAERLGGSIESAHRSVTGAVERNLGLRGMGATIVAALVDRARSRAILAHVGDSRAYVYRDRRLELLTADHSWVHEQVVAGLLSEEDARTHPLKNVVTRALGGTQDPVVDVSEVELRHGDLLMLCSDGLNTMLSDGDIEEVMARETSLEALSQELIDEANRRGGIDNITVILLRMRA